MYLASQKNLFLKKFILYILFIILITKSCKKDDNSIDVRDIAEQALLDDSTLKIYLETHLTINYKQIIIIYNLIIFL